MPNPTLSMVHVDGPLTNISIAYLQDARKFVADRVFPTVSVAKQSDLYFEFDKEDFLRDEFGLKAPGAGPDMGGFDIDASSTYYCRVRAYAHAIPDQIRSNQDAPLQLENAALQFALQKALIKRESTFVSTYMTTGVWSLDITGVAAAPGANQVLQWNDDSSTPIEDITAGMDYVESQTGFRPNKLTLGRQVWSELRNHPDVVDRVKYSGGVGNSRPAEVSLQAFAALCELDEVLVASGVRNTAEKGATAAIDYIAGKTAMLTFSPATPTLMMPSAGYTFAWSGFLGSQGTGVRVKNYRDDEKFEQDLIEVQMSYDQKVVSSDMGYFFTSIVA